MQLKVEFVASEGRSINKNHTELNYSIKVSCYYYFLGLFYVH